MSSRKEQKEALKRERLAREQAAAQAAARKRLIGIVVASILVLGIIGALVAVVLAGGDDDGGTSSGGDSSVSVSYPDGGEIPAQKEADLAAAMKAAGCKDETVTDHPYDDPKGIHTADPNEVIPYKSEPPALGRHYQVPIEDGIYDEAQPITHTVHALEHGRIIIWLRPDLPSDQLAQFKALFEEDPYHVIMLPRAEIKQPFAVSAWVGETTGHILRCNDVNDSTWDAIRAFKEKYRDKAPEFVP
jgi:uncharacterized protein DUF3105